MKKRTHALTLLEALIVVLIIGMLAAMLYPVFESLKMKMKVFGTVQRMQQFHIALQMYRQEWNGADVFTSYKSYYAIGLPATSSPWALDHLEPALPGIERRHWESPCFAGGLSGEEHIARLRLGGVAGHINYAAGLYNPEFVGDPRAGNVIYINYIPQYRSDIVVLSDVHCNPPNVAVLSPYARKKGVALRLSGQVAVIERTESLKDLFWFHID